MLGEVYSKDKKLFVNYRVRNYHVDSYGHVNNATYLNFLEDARTDFFAYMDYPLSYLREKGVFIFITEIKIKYLKPAFLDDIITVSGYFSQILKVRAIWHQEIFRGQEKLIDAYVTGAFINTKGKPIKIPAYILSEMEKVYEI